MSSLHKMVSSQKKSPVLMSSLRKMNPSSAKLKPPSSRQRGKFQHKNLAVEWENEGNLTKSQITQINTAIFSAVDYYYKILKDESYGICLWESGDNILTAADTEKPFGMRLVYDNNRSAEGSAGTRGFTITAGTTNLFPDRNNFINVFDSPVYATLHELHHMFGSRKEFDAGSEAAYLGYIFQKHINNPKYSTIKQYIAMRTRALMNTRHLRKESNYAESASVCSFLYRKYPSIYTSILKQAGYKQSYIKEFVDDVVWG